MATETKEREKGSRRTGTGKMVWLYCIIGRYSVFLRII